MSPDTMFLLGIAFGVVGFGTVIAVFIAQEAVTRREARRWRNEMGGE